jgi:hypothetical protein
MVNHSSTTLKDLIVLLKHDMKAFRAERLYWERESGEDSTAAYAAGQKEQYCKFLLKKLGVIRDVLLCLFVLLWSFILPCYTG